MIYFPLFCNNFNQIFYTFPWVGTLSFPHHRLELCAPCFALHSETLFFLLEIALHCGLCMSQNLCVFQRFFYVSQGWLCCWLYDFIYKNFLCEAINFCVNNSNCIEFIDFYFMNNATTSRLCLVYCYYILYFV